MATPACRAAFERLLGDPALAGLGAQPAALRILDGKAHGAIIAADALLLASGTAALEAMLAKRPMVVAYRVARITYALVKLFGLLRTSVYSLPDIFAGRNIVPELMQDDCTPAAIAAALAPALRARTAEPDLLAEFGRLHMSLRAPPAQDAGAAIADLLAPT